MAIQMGSYERYPLGPRPPKRIPFDLATVRALANQCGYIEIDFNEASSLVSFRKDSVRINVYYTTQTVGTCLNHPTKGKTQLFRREVSMDRLEEIFNDPRTHTGQGYYTRRNLRQQWKCSDDDSFVSDMARRWTYVCAAADLSRNPTHYDMIKRAMNKIDAILWEAGSLPDITETRYNCGSRCALEEAILEVARHDGAIGYIDRNDPHRIFRKSSQCKFFYKFRKREDNRRDIQLVQSLLEQLPQNIRTHICEWVIGLLKCGHSLVTADGDYFVDHDECFREHFDYAELVYPKKELTKMCKFHGIHYSKNYED